MIPLDGQTRDWLEHAFTRRLKKHVADQRELALTSLLSACRKTEDADVARKVAAFDEVESFMKIVGKEIAHGRDDGDD